ncbi:hypothetical protein [Micromonospora wenchangensis]|uniref:hypothetical protein n=1 Tax=Micromonospora wenchangensis TaxID=1185415 RepID=UPI0037F17771
MMTASRELRGAGNRFLVVAAATILLPATAVDDEPVSAPPMVAGIVLLAYGRHQTQTAAVPSGSVSRPAGPPAVRRPTAGALAAQWLTDGQAHKQPTVNLQSDAPLDRKVLPPHIGRVIPVNHDRHSCEVHHSFRHHP